MALLAGLASLLGRFAGRVLNTTLGWATTLLFGRVSQRSQTVMQLIVLGALGWVALVVGVLVPDVGSFLLTMLPLPDFIDESWVRLAMLAAAVLLPLVIGAAAVYMTVPADRPKGAALLVAIVRGYPFTFALALTIAVLAGVATVRKLRAMAKRWGDTHVAVIVKPGGYERVLALLEQVLDKAGLEMTLKPAPWLVSAPPRLLDKVAGHGLGGLVPDRMMLLTSPSLEVLVYPSDLAISGTNERVARARAAILSQLVRAPAYLTTTAEAQKVEDVIAAAYEGKWQAEAKDPDAGFAALDATLADLLVPPEEWESLYRQRLQLERDVLRGKPHVPGAVESPLAASAATDSPGPTRWLGRVAAAGLAGLLALDVALLALDRRKAPAEDDY